MIIIFLILIILFVFLFYNYDFFTDLQNFKYTAVIIEPRKHKALEFVLNNFLENLDENWQIIIFHGDTNEEFVKDIVINKLKNYKDRIKLENLNVDNLTINDYNNLLKSKSFYDNIPTETFLIFQTDSIICKKFKDNINLFLDYDYVGAPWWYGELGNGGLSLRKKSKMLEILDTCPLIKVPEDEYFSFPCPDVQIRKPNFDFAKKFSIEQVYNNESFGIHKVWSNLNSSELELVKNQCEGLDKLIELN